MESLAHTPFILAAYGIAFVVLSGLALWIWQRGRSVSARLKDLEASQPSRRALRREASDEA